MGFQNKYITLSRMYQQDHCMQETKAKTGRRAMTAFVCWQKACLRNKCRLASCKTSEVESDGQGVIDQRKLEEDSWR